MTDKELRRMNRRELLEMLVAQMEENQSLKSQLQAAQAQLEDRRIQIEKAGSISEAALQLNGVFDAAQAAAQQYLDNISRLSADQDAICRRIEAEARTKADAVVAEANAYSQKTHDAADNYWRQVLANVRKVIQEEDAKP